jgi:hypothetical protein
MRSGRNALAGFCSRLRRSTIDDDGWDQGLAAGHSGIAPRSAVRGAETPGGLEGPPSAGVPEGTERKFASSGTGVPARRSGPVAAVTSAGGLDRSIRVQAARDAFIHRRSAEGVDRDRVLSQLDHEPVDVVAGQVPVVRQMLGKLAIAFLAAKRNGSEAIRAGHTNEPQQRAEGRARVRMGAGRKCLDRLAWSPSHPNGRR